MEEERETYTIDIKAELAELDLLGYDLRERGGGIDKLFTKLATVLGNSKFSVQYSFANGTLTIEEPESLTMDKASLLDALGLKEG